MPNRVINEVILHGLKLEDCRQHLLDDAGALSSEVLAPPPVKSRPGTADTAEERAVVGRVLLKSSDTGWNAYGAPSVEETDAGVVIRFESAWSHPRAWTCALFRILNCNITASWLSEGGYAAHIEQYSVDDAGGLDWVDTEIADGSDAHRHLHKLLWGVEAFEGGENDD